MSTRHCQANQSGDKYTATVEAFSTTMDLAVLRLDDETFFDTRAPLPRAWAIPLNPEAAASVSGSTLNERSRGVEAFLRVALRDGSIDADRTDLTLERTGATIRLRGVEKIARYPALIFLSMNYWPAWKPQDAHTTLVAPFGFIALVLGGRPTTSVTLTFASAGAPVKSAALALILGATLGLAILRRR